MSSSHMVTFNKIVVFDRAAITQGQRPVFNGVLDRPPNTVTKDSVVKVSYQMNFILDDSQATFQQVMGVFSCVLLDAKYC